MMKKILTLLATYLYRILMIGYISTVGVVGCVLLWVLWVLFIVVPDTNFRKWNNGGINDLLLWVFCVPFQGLAMLGYSIFCILTGKEW